MKTRFEPFSVGIGWCGMTSFIAFLETGQPYYLVGPLATVVYICDMMLEVARVAPYGGRI